MGMKVEYSALPEAERGGRRGLAIAAESSLLVDAIVLGARTHSFKLRGRFGGGADSVRAIVASDPDVVLVDDSTSSDEVLTTLAGVRAQDSSVLLVVLTVREDDLEWLDAAAAAGADFAISKGINPGLLFTLLGEILDRKVLSLSARPHAHAVPYASPSGPQSPLTAREREILALMASGATNSSIARQLHVTEQTVSSMWPTCCASSGWQTAPRRATTRISTDWSTLVSPG